MDTYIAFKKKKHATNRLPCINYINLSDFKIFHLLAAGWVKRDHTLKRPKQKAKKKGEIRITP